MKLFFIYRSVIFNYNFKLFYAIMKKIRKYNKIKNNKTKLFNNPIPKYFHHLSNNYKELYKQKDISTSLWLSNNHS